MKTANVSDALILWSAKHSTVHDLSTKAFAQRLCLGIENGQHSLEVSINEVSEELGISRNSAIKYLKALQDSGEWSVDARKGACTTITPSFLSEAVDEFGGTKN